MSMFENASLAHFCNEIWREYKFAKPIYIEMCCDINKWALLGS